MAKFYDESAAPFGADSSDVSDVDPAELDKMVEGIDDLDADLFGTAHRKKGREITAAPDKRVETRVMQDTLTPSQKTQAKSQNSGLKLPGFEAFDSDGDSDPLADLDDLLSESTRKKEPIKTLKQDGIRDSNKYEVTTANVDSLPANEKNKKKLISDLFGSEKPIGHESDNKNVVKSSVHDAEESFQTNAKTVNFSSLSVEKRIPSLKTTQSKIKSTHSSENINETMNVEDDLLEGMGLEKHENPTRKSSNKKSSIMDALLGKNTVQSAKPVIEKTSLEKDAASVKETNIAFGGYSPTIGPGTSQPRRSGSRRLTTSDPDPLGILSPTSTPKKTVKISSSNKSEGRDSALWLGLSSVPSPSHVSPVHLSKTLPTNVANSSEMISQSKTISANITGANDLVARNQPGKVLEENQSTSLSPIRQANDHDWNKANTAQLPEWLGGGPNTQEKISVPNVPKIAPAQAASSTEHLSTQSFQPPQLSSSVTADPVGYSSGIDSSVTASLLRQEASLALALQLRQHEQQTKNLIHKQTALLQQQEQQLHILVAQQVERQKKLDTALADQQKRIASYLEALTMQPLIPEELQFPAVHINKVPDGQNSENKNHTTESKEEIVVQPVAVSWEEDKKCLEEIIETLKDRHSQELQLLEDSYKRQISILKESLENQEEYFRSENLKHKHYFEGHLNQFQEFTVELKKNHKIELVELSQKHEKEIKSIKEQHTITLEQVRSVLGAEIGALKEIHSSSGVLNVALEKLGQNSQDIDLLREKMSGEHTTVLEIKTAALEAKEKALQASRADLERQRAVAEEERTQMKALMAQLEDQLALQKCDVDELRTNLQQERAHLEARQKAMEREFERITAQLERERQHIQQQKQALADEREAYLRQIKEEHLKLAAEKSRIETLARLNKTEEIDKQKVQAEIEAAVSTVHTARQEAEMEIAKLKDERRKLDTEWLRLRAAEEDLVARNHQLESISQGAAALREEGLQALEEARELGDQYNKRVLEIQQQHAALQKQEQKLSEDKRNLAQERLTLRKMYTPALCSKCKISFGDSSADPSLSAVKDELVDPKVVMMKLVAEKDDHISTEERYTILSSLPTFQSISK